METTYYGSLCSLFYDIDKPSAPKNELDFYLSYAKQNMSILEPMCGSGRFLLEFARLGFSIDGFDVSHDMLELCEQKLDKDKLISSVSNCDFLDFESDKLYDFIFIAGSSFSLLTDSDIAFASLDKLMKLMTKGGILSISIETNSGYKDRVSNEDKYEFFGDETREWKCAEHDGIEILLKKGYSYNASRGILYSPSVYELYKNGKFVKREQENLYLKLYKPNEFENLVSECGMKILNKYTDYNKTLFSGRESDLLIYDIVL